MSLDYTRLKTAFKNGVLNDPDGKYGSGDVQPDNSNELEAWAHYMAKAVVEEFDANAQTDAGIEVEDSGGTKIGETRQGSAGVVS